MAISAFLPAARVLATKVASNPEVQEFGKDVLKKVEGTAVEAGLARLTRGVGGEFAAPEGLARRTAPATLPPGRQDGVASQMRRSTASNALALLKTAQQSSSIAAQAQALAPLRGVQTPRDEES